jgi:hypothetical protein
MRLDQYVLPGSLDRKQHTEKELVTTA